eukprot:SAG31_NODE_1586_length_7821_cov_3.086765_7_plen_109_part_00
MATKFRSTSHSKNCRHAPAAARVPWRRCYGPIAQLQTPHGVCLSEEQQHSDGFGHPLVQQSMIVAGPIILFSCVQRWTQENSITGAAEHGIVALTDEQRKLQNSTREY